MMEEMIDIRDERIRDDRRDDKIIIDQPPGRMIKSV